MTLSNFRRLVFVVVLTSIGAAKPAHAGLLGLADASSIIQSTASDQDFEFLYAFYGGQSQSLNYSSTSSATSWIGTLSGTYLGSTVVIGYAGDLSSYLSTGTVTWTSTGNYGLQTWSGTGSATITDTSATTFNVAFKDSITVGSNTGSINYVIPGTVLPNGNVMYGSPSDKDVGTGTATLNGTAYAGVSYFSYLRFWPYIICDYNGNYPFPPWIPSDNYYKTTSATSTSVDFGLTGYIASVPEPSSLLLLGVGLLGGTLHMLRWRKGLRACERGRS